MDSLTLSQIVIAWLAASVPVSLFVGHCIFSSNRTE